MGEPKRYLKWVSHLQSFKIISLRQSWKSHWGSLYNSKKILSVCVCVCDSSRDTKGDNVMIGHNGSKGDYIFMIYASVDPELMEDCSVLWNKETPMKPFGNMQYAPNRRRHLLHASGEENMIQEKVPNLTA